MSTTPGNPGGPPGYTLDWENPADREALCAPSTSSEHPSAPPGWSGEYDPDQDHDGEPQVRPTVGAEPARLHANAVRFELRSGDKRVRCGVRCELAGDHEPASAERWYGFSIYLPDAEPLGPWAPDPASEIVTQWHQVVEGGSPPLALLIQRDPTDGLSHWFISRRVFGTNDTDEHPVGPCDLGVWTDWVFYVRWASDASGRIHIWKNLVDVPGFAPRTGQNTFTSTERHYIKIGIYKFLWNAAASGDIAPPPNGCTIKTNTSTVGRRVMFHDELRIVEGPESLGPSVVSPPAGARPSAATAR